MTIDELVAHLAAAERHDPSQLRRDQIPQQPGIYVWYSKATGCPVYVGKASGKSGLRRRIWSQHLNPAYLEGRPEKLHIADEFQVSCAVIVRGQPRIDKSVFRRSIGRRERIAPGQPTVDFIRQNLEIVWAVLAPEDIPNLEVELIRRFADQWDLYNISGGRPRAS